jgi:hypothetical protein
VPPSDEVNYIQNGAHAAPFDELHAVWVAGAGRAVQLLVNDENLFIV